MGKITDWNYIGYYIALGKIGREVEPNGIERETSQVWTKILTDLWNRGFSLSRIAEEIKIPERELNGLLFGIATAQAPGQRTTSPFALRLVPK